MDPNGGNELHSPYRRRFAIAAVAGGVVSVVAVAVAAVFAVLGLLGLIVLGSPKATDAALFIGGIILPIGFAALVWHLLERWLSEVSPTGEDSTGTLEFELVRGRRLVRQASVVLPVVAGGLALVAFLVPSQSTASEEDAWSQVRDEEQAFNVVVEDALGVVAVGEWEVIPDNVASCSAFASGVRAMSEMTIVGVYDSVEVATEAMDRLVGATEAVGGSAGPVNIYPTSRIQRLKVPLPGTSRSAQTSVIWEDDAITLSIQGRCYEPD